MRIASSIRSTPTPLISVTNSACCQDIGTKLTAPRLYASSGWIVSIADTRLAWSSRSPSTNRTSDRCLLTHERRGLAWPRMRPHTWYPSAIRCSARYDPSCPVIPVISARLDMRQPFWLLSARRSRCHGRRRQLSRTNIGVAVRPRDGPGGTPGLALAEALRSVLHRGVQGRHQDQRQDSGAEQAADHHQGQRLADEPALA